MTLQIDLPDEILALLGNDPKKEVLESLLLHLIQEQRITVARAGELLGLDRMDTISWYTHHGYYFPDLDETDLENEFDHASL